MTPDRPSRRSATGEIAALPPDVENSKGGGTLCRSGGTSGRIGRRATDGAEAVDGMFQNAAFGDVAAARDCHDNGRRAGENDTKDKTMVAISAEEALSPIVVSPTSGDRGRAQEIATDHLLERRRQQQRFEGIHGMSISKEEEEEERPLSRETMLNPR